MKNLSKELFCRTTGMVADENHAAYLNWLEEQVREQEEMRENILKCQEDIAKVIDEEDIIYG